MTSADPASSRATPSKGFDLRPSRKAAAQMGALLWGLVYAITLLISVPLGHVANLPDFLTVLGGFLASLAMSAVLYLAFGWVQGWPRWPANLALVGAAVLCAFGACLGDYGSQFAVHAVYDTVLPSLEPRDIAMVQTMYLCLFAVNLAMLWVTAVNRRSIEEEKRLAQAQVNAAKAEAQAARAEVAALHYQLNPHFLLNSLNAVSSLIEQGRHKAADETVLRVAGFLREVLKMEPAGKVTLMDEIDHAMSYLDIQHVRFPDKIDTEVRCPDQLRNALVPSMVLQPLIENAIKYAVAPADSRVQLSVVARAEGGKLVLTVEDDGRVAAAASDSTGIGLANIRGKLQTYYGDAGVLHVPHRAAGYCVELHMPLEFASAEAGGGERLQA